MNTINNIWLMDYQVHGGVVLTEQEANQLTDRAMTLLGKEPRFEQSDIKQLMTDCEFDEQTAINRLTADWAVEQAAKDLGFKYLPEHLSINFD
jgi:hypothetical protein